MSRTHRLAIHWFRRDLRLHDNTALHAATTNAARVLPVYVVSSWRKSHRWTGAPRQAFLCGCLESLDRDITRTGGRLIFRRGDAVDALRELIIESGADALHFNRDPGEPSPRATETRVQRMAAGLGVAVHDFKDAVLHEGPEVLTGSGAPFRVFTPYSRAWRAIEKPAIVPRITGIDSPEGVRSDPVPALDTWALEPSGIDGLPPGEAAARRRMQAAIEKVLPGYATNRNFPAGQTTSRLSQDLRFGLISIRELHQRVLDAKTAAPGIGNSADAFIDELAWREFHMAILWHFPEVFEHEFDPAWRGLPWDYDGEKFERWRVGETGFPIVDAGMRQLAATGFMHNRVRMIVAMFLTKDLHLDWRLGEQWFMQSLVDGESASNNGGWQWSAGTGADAAPYFRIQNPWRQTRQFDPEGRYIKAWVHELKDVDPTRLWTDPATGRGERVARGYPTPIVDHAAERARTLTIFQNHRRRREGW